MSTEPFQFTAQWEPYKNIVESKVFDCINCDSKVLEVGPFEGWFTDLILKKDPKYVELVEANVQASDFLDNKYKNYSNVNVICADIFDKLLEYKYQCFDVVVAFGVLYHWHNPFEFLEQVVNVIGPQYICLDNPSPPQVYLSGEDHNIPGARNTVIDKKTVGLSLSVPNHYINQAMTNLGYSQQFWRPMSDIPLNNKNDFAVWKWQSNDSLRQR